MRRGRVLFTLAAAALGAALGCQTVDLGTPPADVNLCAPSQQFFIDQIWPNFLAQDYGGKHCYDVSCHAPGGSAQMTLTNPVEAPAIPLPTDWAADYTQVTHRMNCSDAADSDLVIYPENRVPHGGGMLIMPTGPEVALIAAWVTAP